MSSSLTSKFETALGFAFQLSTLRFLGFCPNDLTRCPSLVSVNVKQVVA